MSESEFYELLNFVGIEYFPKQFDGKTSGVLIVNIIYYITINYIVSLV